MRHPYMGYLDGGSLSILIIPAAPMVTFSIDSIKTDFPRPQDWEPVPQLS